jgi:hypothetical protein
MMKAIVSTLIISLLAFPAFCQSAIKTIGKSSLKKDNEFFQELSKAFEVVHKDFSVQLDTQDTLYIIRGIDIQSRTAYGRIWNNKYVYHYTDSKERKNNRIVGPNPIIAAAEDMNVTEDFDSLILDIEKGNTEKIMAVTKANPVMSGIINWYVITYISQKGLKPRIEYYTLNDFAIIK